MSKIGRLRVVVWNKGKDAYLKISENGEPEMVSIIPGRDDDKLKNPEWIRSQNLLWEINYVTSAWSAGDVTLAVLAPAAVAALVVAWYAAPAIAAGVFASYGLAALPVIQVIGAAAATTAQLTASALVSALVWKAVV